MSDSTEFKNAGLSRRSLLQGTAGMAGILASGLAPANGTLGRKNRYCSRCSGSIGVLSTPRPLSARQPPSAPSRGQEAPPAARTSPRVSNSGRTPARHL